MHSELEDVLRRKLGNLAPTMMEIEKQKLGLTGSDIPESLKEDFIRGLIFLCESEVKIDIDQDLREELEHTLD